MITVTGQIYTGWLSRQLEKVGLSKQIAADWFQSLADFVPGVERHATLFDNLSRFILLHEIEPVMDQFLTRVQLTIDTIQTPASETRREHLTTSCSRANTKPIKSQC